MFYMRQRCGAWQSGGDQNGGALEFRVFFPAGFDPEITEIRVAGDFQHALGGTDWDFPGGVLLTRRDIDEGTFYEVVTTQVPADFYEYKYFVRFTNGESRIVTDPCTRYGGTENQNAAVVIGGSQPLAGYPRPHPARQPLRDLVVYELMLDDFTDEYRDGRAPLSAAIDQLDRLRGLGFNAILFMPWTAWKNRDYDWGYEPFQYFSVEYRYANEENRPAEKLSFLADLVDACHARGLHVIMDGVFNHVSYSFAYPDFYLNRSVCPFTGQFGGVFPGLQDLNFNNRCTQDLVRDVCLYFIDEFRIDGIRLDNTTNYDVPGNLRGLPTLLQEVADYADANAGPNFSFTLEHLSIDAASVTNGTRATSYWDNELYARTFDALWSGRVDHRLLQALDHARFVNFPGKVPTQYLSNHDHSQVAAQAGLREAAGIDRWYRTQPYAIALFTGTSVPMLHSGQELGEEYRLPEDDHGTGRRVIARPLHYKFANDNIGTTLGNLYGVLARARRDHPGLRSANIWPTAWEDWQTQFNPQGAGIDESRQVIIYHRWGNTPNGDLERFVIVLNFSDSTQHVSVPFPVDGTWTDLLSGFNGSWQPVVTGGRLEFDVGSNWGNLFFRVN
jgi:1,4-alpha-glucan branching enzyme